MSVTQTVVFEMYLTNTLVDEAGYTLVDETGAELTADGWVDVTSDVLITSRPTWTRGNSGHTIFDRVANIGSLSFELDNSEYNSNTTLGYYSPEHNNVVSRFGLDTAVRITITDA